MKNLNLNDFGVQEMNAEEMRGVDGGLGSIFWLIVGVVISECLDRNAGKDFQDGWNAAKNK